MPLSRVSGEIQGEIYKKGIYISKHCEEHFKTLSAKFDLSNNDLDIAIYRKIEENLNVVYNRFQKATPIGKEIQAELGICFTIQMTQKGTFIIWIKKNFKDVETFLEHYYRVFDFLDYEEHGRLLDLFYIQKENKKLFDYIHLTNKVGPKLTIDKDFKGSHVKVEYCTLKSGKKIINVKIDYSDPHDPELEIEGPEAECRNLRDILVYPSKTLPTINNIGKWSLDVRNNTKDLKFQNERLFDQISSTGQTLQLIKKSAENYHQDSLAENSEINARVYGLDIKTDINHLETKEALKGVYECIQGNTTVLDLGIQELKDEYKDVIGDLEKDVVSGINTIDRNLEKTKDEITLKIDELKENFESKLDLIWENVLSEFGKVKFRIKNALYLILTNDNRNRDLTIKELVKELKMPRTSLLSYLKKLQEKGLIESEKLKTGKRGRPPKIFKSTKKLHELFQKIKKNEVE